MVDNRPFKRIAYRVLDRDPTQDALTAVFRRFPAALERRGLTSRGITTDGSSRPPVPIAAAFGAVPHQLCTSPVLRALTEAVLGAVTEVRKGRAVREPKLERGRPNPKAARRAARPEKRREQKGGDRFEHRYLFVRRQLSPARRRTLLRISRGRPQLRALRALLEEVSRPLDRRCRTDAALAERAPLRRHVRRSRRAGAALKAPFPPNLEEALTFLDDRLLPATPNAVGRGDRRYRKMQEGIDRVRTEAQIAGRRALDLLRESPARDRAETTGTLHRARAA